MQAGTTFNICVQTFRNFGNATRRTRRPAGENGEFLSAKRGSTEKVLVFKRLITVIAPPICELSR